MDDERQTDDLPAGMTGHGLRGRAIARGMIVIAITSPVLPGLLLMSAPRGMGGGMASDLNPLAAFVVGGGILAYVTGLAWMIRIYRADPEAHESFWRSRRH